MLAAEVHVAEAEVVQNADDPIRLVAAGDVVFTVTRQQASYSGTIREMLEGDSRVEGAPADELRFPELEGPLMQEAVRYLRYRSEPVDSRGVFPLDGAQAVAMYRVACYLDL